MPRQPKSKGGAPKNSSNKPNRGEKRKAESQPETRRVVREVAVDESEFVSHDPSDTGFGFGGLINFTINRFMWSPEDVLKKKPRGIPAKKKAEGHVEYPPDLVLYDLWRNRPEEYRRLKEKMFSNPKCGGMDFFTEGLYTQLKAHGNEAFHEGKSYVSYSDALDSPNAVKRTLDKEDFGNRFMLPFFHEEPNNSFLNLRGRKNDKFSDLMLEGFNKMKLFDFMPTYFDSDEEAAVYFEHTIRQFLPENDFADRINTICHKKHIDADLSAICFTGIGQWFMNAIERAQDGTVVGWHNREAKDECLRHIPRSAVVVVDVSMAGKYPVRSEFERYGAAIFFNQKQEAVGIWIDHEEEMVFPPSDPNIDRLSDTARDWEFAEWRCRVSLYFQGFAVGHLVSVHWGMSNSLVVGTRESLDPHHPLRELITPYTHGAISINKAAVVNLGSARGAIVRIGALQMGEYPQMLINELADQFKYETFPQFLKSKGKFPKGMLESMPMVQDGMKLWDIIHEFIAKYLNLYYDDEASSSSGSGAKYVSEDSDVVAFWNKCKDTSNAFCALPELNLQNLIDYITTCIFYFTAVHELLGNVNFMTMMPRCLSGRIHKRERFGNRPFQASIQDWYRIICVVTATTLKSVPKLINEQFRSAKYFYGKAAEQAQDGMNSLDVMHMPDVVDHVLENHKAPRCFELAECFQTFGDKLVKLSEEITALNEERLRRNECTFGSFNPKRMEVSVSL